MTASDVADYLQNSADSYASSMAPPIRPGHSDGPTPAAATTTATSVNSGERDNSAQAVAIVRQGLD